MQIMQFKEKNYTDYVGPSLTISHKWKLSLTLDLFGYLLHIAKGLMTKVRNFHFLFIGM